MVVDTSPLEGVASRGLAPKMTSVLRRYHVGIVSVPSACCSRDFLIKFRIAFRNPTNARAVGPRVVEYLCKDESVEFTSH